MDPHLDKLASEAYGLCLVMLRNSRPRQDICRQLAPILRKLYEGQPQTGPLWRKFSALAYPPPPPGVGYYGGHVGPFEFWRRIETGICQTFERGAVSLRPDPLILEHCSNFVAASDELDSEVKEMPGETRPRLRLVK